MKKTIILSLLSAVAMTTAQATPVKPLNTDAQILNFRQVTTSFNVRIALIDIHGNPIGDNRGLQGYWARNEATGVYYYPEDRDENRFENLPAGTYTFGARNGAWDGASQETVTLSSGQVGPDGYILINLTYWVE